MSVPSEILKLVSESGNNFHAKVARWMQKNGWRVAVSPYYMDQTQNKAREIDLVVEKLFSVRDRQDPGPLGHVTVRLFIECKFIPLHSVFWFTDKDMEAVKQLVCSSGKFNPDHSYTKQHHYLAASPRVAKLYATEKGSDNDPYYKALNQVLSAMISMRGKQVSPALLKPHHGPVLLLEFPVVVCSSFDRIYEVDFYDENSSPRRVGINFQLEIEYAYLDQMGSHRDEYLLLDFVEFNQLDTFVSAVEEDARIAGFFHNWR
ncbi:MAG: hypothetical protein FWG26_01155 [Betaproteobacteria bacterium]|nr:hypothetical protein [Betaproteobacteria bacterium]